MAYIDGETGQVAVEPDDITLAAFQAKYQKQQEMRALLQDMKGQEDVTLDGRKLMVYCNIGSPEDIAAVLANDGRGIGLFRSEFLYLASDDYHNKTIRPRKISSRHTRKWRLPWKAGEWSFVHWISELTSR